MNAGWDSVLVEFVRLRLGDGLRENPTNDGDPCRLDGELLSSKLFCRWEARLVSCRKLSLPTLFSCPMLSSTRWLASSGRGSSS